MSTTADVRNPSPPFSRTAKLARFAGDHVWVVCGPEAWERAKAKRGANETAPVLLCPPGEDPYRYHWPVMGLDVTVLDTGAGEEALEALGHALLRDGAPLVVLLLNLGERIVVFPKEAVTDAA